MFFESLRSRFPTADAAHLKALADVWTEELELIIKRMIDISVAEGCAALPQAARHEAVFELANLQLWLVDRIIEKKTEGAPIEGIDPEAERLALNTPAELERIETTARGCADYIWKHFQEEWHKKYPLIVTPEQNTRRQRKSLPTGHGAAGVQQQHYSPTFSNRYWASGNQNKVRRYGRGVDLKIKHRDVGYKTWGQEDFIYSQALERYLSLVEGDARQPYSRLLDTIPLSEDDRRHWVAYITVQLLRTPAFIVRNLPRLRQVIASRGINYPNDIGSLRRVYETLFTNNDVFAIFYRRLVGRRWEIWKAPPGVAFIRSDDPVLVEGSTTRSTWRLVYPMTPLRCFVAGPEKADAEPVVIPTTKLLTEAEAWSLNERVAKAARRTVIGRPGSDDSILKCILESSLGSDWIGRNFLSEVFPEYWGGLT